MGRISVRAVLVALAVVCGSVHDLAAQTVPGPAPAPSDAFFDDTVLHSISLVINSRDWRSLKEHYLENTYYPCDMRWGDHVVRNIGIRSRGTGSRSGVKPGLRVDFDRYTTDQKFLGLKSFILRNNSQDASGMHERISMAFFRRMGVPASREAHTRLYVNNEFAGLYTIVESVDKTFLDRTFNESDGYLFKYDYSADDLPYYFEYRGSDPDLYVPHPFKPETHESDPHPEAIAELVRIVNKDGDAIFRSTVAPFIDFANFIKHIAIEIFLADADGFNGNWGTNNFYFYRFEHNNLFKFIPWDKSEAFKSGPEYSIWHNILDLPPSQRNSLTIRMLGYDDLRNQFLDTLVACANSLSQTDPTDPTDTRGWMEREIEREYQQIKDWAAVADEDKEIYTKEQFELEVASLRAFARRRPDIIREEVAKARSSFSLSSVTHSGP